MLKSTRRHVLPAAVAPVAAARVLGGAHVPVAGASTPLGALAASPTATTTSSASASAQTSATNTASAQTSATNTASANTSTTTPAGSCPDWRRKTPSVTADPAAITAGVRRSKASRVRVTVTSERAGRPVVSVATVDAAAATATVDKAQDTAGTLAVEVDRPVRSTTWSDPLRPRQWGVTRLAGETTRAAASANGTIVAVVDSGIQANHPDLAGHLVPGVDLINPATGARYDGYGHGTHVAGIIAAATNNARGVSGIAPDARLMSVRVLDSTGAGWSSTVAQGIVWAVDHAARVINVSLGGGYSASTSTAVSYARSKGALVVAAAGNERQTGNATTYPAAYPSVLAVAASDSSDRSASFSNTGSYVDVAAPGVDIVSTYLDSGYAMMSGTSMAAPFVSGEAAVLLGARPSLTVDQVTAALTRTAVDRGTVGRDDQFGAGIVSPTRAVCSVTSCPSTSRWTSVPSTARKASTITVQGRVVNPTTGAAVGGAKVQICTRKVGTTPWVCRPFTATSTGVVTWRLLLLASVDFQLRTLAAAGVRASVSPISRTTVR